MEAMFATTLDMSIMGSESFHKIWSKWPRALTEESPKQCVRALNQNVVAMGAYAGVFSFEGGRKKFELKSYVVDNKHLAYGLMIGTKDMDKFTVEFNMGKVMGPPTIMVTEIPYATKMIAARTSSSNEDDGSIAYVSGSYTGRIKCNDMDINVFIATTTTKCIISEAALAVLKLTKLQLKVSYISCCNEAVMPVGVVDVPMEYNNNHQTIRAAILSDMDFDAVVQDFNVRQYVDMILGTEFTDTVAFRFEGGVLRFKRGTVQRRQVGQIESDNVGQMQSDNVGQMQSGNVGQMQSGNGGQMQSGNGGQMQSGNVGQMQSDHGRKGAILDRRAAQMKVLII